MRKSVFTFVLICMACCAGKVYAQDSIQYSYDSAGNRTGREYVAQLTALVEERMCRWQEPQLLATYQIRCLAKRRTTEDNEYAAVYTSVPVSWESSFKDELHDRICGIIISLNNNRRSSHDEEI